MPLAEAQALVESLITTLSSVDVSSDLKVLEQVSTAVYAATTNPDQVTQKSAFVGVDFAKSAADTLSRSDATIDQIEGIVTSLLGALGSALVSVASNSNSSEPTQETTTPGFTNSNENVSRNYSLLEQNAMKASIALTQLAAALLD